jgi:hypothetical protein
MKHILCPLEKAYRGYEYKALCIPDLGTRQKFVVPLLGLVFSDAIPLGLVNRYRQFKGICFLHLQGSHFSFLPKDADGRFI